MPSPARPPSLRRRLFAVGGPVFNALLVLGFFAIVAFVVASPTRLQLESGGDGDSGTLRVEVADGPPAPDGAAEARTAASSGRRDAASVLQGAISPLRPRSGAATTSPGPDTVAVSGPANGAADRQGGASAPERPPTGALASSARAATTPAPGAPAAPAPTPEAPAASAGGPGQPGCEAAAGQPCPPPATSPPTAPAPLTKADLVEPSHRVYGLHTREAPGWMAEVDEIAGLVGRAPDTLLFFTNFGRPFPAESVEASWARDMAPIVSWEPIVPGSTVGQPRLADIYEGAYDGYIDAWAAAARNQGAPIVLRFAHEMNGDWYSWSEGVNGNEVGDYARAWRYLHDRFAAVGAHNVLWLWSVNRVDSVPTPLAPLYPGDAYVDWVGMSGFLRAVVEGEAPSFDATFGRTLAELRAVAPAKRILLSEVAAGTDEASRVTWARSLFAGLASAPDVLGFVWFNDAKSGGDWRLQISAPLVEAMAEGLADPAFGAGWAVAAPTP